MNEYEKQYEEKHREHLQWVRRVRWTILAIPLVLTALIVYRMVSPVPKKEPKVLWQREVKPDLQDEIRKLFESQVEPEKEEDDPDLSEWLEMMGVEDQPGPKPSPPPPPPPVRPQPIAPASFTRRATPEPTSSAGASVAAIKGRFELARLEVDDTASAVVEPVAGDAGATLVAGTLLPAVLLQTTTSDEPGLVQARIAHDVYDTLSGRHLVIPAGTTLIGRTVGLGAARQGVEMVWQRLIFPSGRSLAAEMVATDRGGGLPSGKRRTHTLQKVGAVLLSASTAAALQVSQRPRSTQDVRFFTPGQVATEEAVRDASRVLDDWAAERLARPPTVILPVGSEILVQLLDDLKI